MTENVGFTLYARPSLCEGLARLVDIGGMLNEYNYSDSPQQADIRAILSDWEAVGVDIRAAIAQFEKEHQEQISNG
jgi:hypothetical protein